MAYAWTQDERNGMRGEMRNFYVSILGRDPLVPGAENQRWAGSQTDERGLDFNTQEALNRAEQLLSANTASPGTHPRPWDEAIASMRQTFLDSAEYREKHSAAGGSGGGSNDNNGIPPHGISSGTLLLVGGGLLLLLALTSSD